MVLFYQVSFIEDHISKVFGGIRWLSSIRILILAYIWLLNRCMLSRKSVNMKILWCTILMCSTTRRRAYVVMLSRSWGSLVNIGVQLRRATYISLYTLTLKQKVCMCYLIDQTPYICMVHDLARIRANIIKTHVQKEIEIRLYTILNSKVNIVGDIYVFILEINTNIYALLIIIIKLGEVWYYVWYMLMFHLIFTNSKKFQDVNRIIARWRTRITNRIR